MCTTQTSVQKTPCECESRHCCALKIQSRQSKQSWQALNSAVLFSVTRLKLRSRCQQQIEQLSERRARWCSVALDFTNLRELCFLPRQQWCPVLNVAFIKKKKKSSVSFFGYLWRRRQNIDVVLQVTVQSKQKKATKEFPFKWRLFQSLAAALHIQSSLAT